MTAAPAALATDDPLADDWRAGGFALYVHWPFCAAKCPYCDFNSHVTAGIDQPRWLAAYRAEIARLGRETPGRVLNSIFFGGGTPSLMAPETVAGVIESARAAWPFANDIEITLEANPTSVETGRFRAYADAGVNRVSMGIQALNDGDLRRLGRMHSVAEARAAFDIARDCFTRVSFDLIYARQDQDRAHWRRELAEALSMAVDHLSAYQLTIEPGTAFGARHAKGGLKGLPDDDLSADMYLDTQEICAAAGMPAYEISNHARPGSESRHNLVYWRQGDWAAVGPGAHGRLTLPGTRWATEAHRAPGAWLDAVQAQGSGDSLRDRLTLSDRGLEYLLMSMRLAEGMQVSRYHAHGGRLPQRQLADLIGLGLVTHRGERLAATAAGRPVLNAILRELAE
ncbi:oxygen-independent coproporphyrinogen-3 oxidase [Paracoccus aminovorans]|uniref:Heme chaperone HemW n=1 Tax=Paracoccus aminovorans TaxID=34004 RepID=A0A1I3BE40_9RHOB|nr:radical SAM family heme chaperone HemW [Paracoccus aminovorans]CQR84790.1 coproporphyrinogen III oxidase [Paracoccus aminovorans]SFH60575.1 oxygen-independent coproporphyrinogen-3 oxidase [Paracoccus aminovorans]